jgi:protein-S-isoprenylcysteine O-methyltransferase Ste14
LLRQGSSGIFLTGMAIWLAGAYIGLWSLLRLRHAFSVVPQARVLVTAGPYRLCRHPVYASYILQYGGLLLGHFSLPFAFAYAAWAGLMRWRIGYEERTLAAAFPEYAAYKERVGMFFPKVAAARRGAEAAPATTLRAAPLLPPSARPKPRSHSARA